MKIIFLDVDGVLNNCAYYNKITCDIDPEKVKLVANICRQTEAKIVIISSWRESEDYTPSFYYTLREVLEQYNVPVSGDAPYIPCDIVDNSAIFKDMPLEDLEKIEIKFGTGRAAEVTKFLKENNVESFVILDDEDFNWHKYNLDKFWIQTTYYDKVSGGLQQEHVEKAINILKGGENAIKEY